VTLSIVLLALLSLGNLLAPLISEGMPTAAVVLLLAVGALGIVGAVGLWMLKRWALWLVIVVSVLNILMNAPAMVSAAPVIYVVVSALVIVLAILPASRHAYS
jgi:uncharacterized membrane protein (DUF2068 family)